MVKKKLTTLSELAKELGINKSKLHYYNSLGLISQEIKLGGLFVYDSEKTKARLKHIEEEVSRGKKLTKIIDKK